MRNRERDVKIQIGAERENEKERESVRGKHTQMRKIERERRRESLIKKNNKNQKK